MLKLTLLFYNATPPPTDFPDLLQIFTVSLQQAYNTLYPFDLQKTSFTYSESNFHVGNLQFFTSSNQSTSNTSLLCIKNIFNYSRTLNVCSPLNATEYLFFKDISCYIHLGVARLFHLLWKGDQVLFIIW